MYACCDVTAALRPTQALAHLQGAVVSDQEQVLCWPVQRGAGVVHPVRDGVHVGAGVAALAAHVLPIKVAPAVAEQLGLCTWKDGTRQH